MFSQKLVKNTILDSIHTIINCFVFLTIKNYFRMYVFDNMTANCLISNIYINLLPKVNISRSKSYTKPLSTVVKYHHAKELVFIVLFDNSD